MTVSASIAAPNHLDWAERNDYWQSTATSKSQRSRSARETKPLILTGHGVSIALDRGTLLIRNGLTHFPQEREIFRLFKGDLELPSRIIMLDGSGRLTFDVISWLSDQAVPLVQIDYTGRVISVIGGSGFASDPEKVRWQIETRNVRWTPSSVQFGGLAKVGSGSFYAASWSSGLALSGASPG